MTAEGSTIQLACLAGLEAAMNRALDLDPRAQKSIADLQGKVFHLKCTKPELELFLHPQAHGVRLTGIWEGEVSTAIAGEAADFAELASSSDAAASLINGKLELHGDSAPLIELQGILSRLDMDWEAPLVDAFGDVVGHQLAQGLRGLFGWGRQAAGSIHRQVEEFIIEEARLTPSRLEVEDFYQDVQALSQKVERMQAKAEKLVKDLEPLQ